MSTTVTSATESVLRKRYDMRDAVQYINEKLKVGITERTFRHWLDREAIPFYRVPGGRYFWSQDLLDRIIESMQHPAPRET